MVISRTLFFLSLSLFFLLAGCSPQNNFPSLTDLNPFTEDTEDIIEEAETSLNSPPELLPEPVEAENYIVQELDALRQTGTWEIKEEIASPPVLEYDFPVVVNKQVEMYLKLFQGKQAKYFSMWLERSGKYIPIIHEELKREGLPLDLTYLAMIESGFNQRAYSRARAVGMWQFMRGTGRDYNLRIDRYIDERRDPIKSTKAAVALLKDLYAQFGDWHLAVAAYNAGPGKIRSGLRRYNVSTFWELAQKKCLGLETKRYVPKLIAAIIIAKNPEKYGFTDLNYAAPLQYDTIEVGPGLNLKALALISGGTTTELMSLNQELLSDQTPLNQTRYLAKIPKNSHDIAKENIRRLHSIVRTGYKTHIKQSGESLTAISNLYNVNKTTLLKVNKLRNGKLEDGQRLRIPYSIADYILLPKDGSSLAKHEGLILYTIKRGDTISKIAKMHNVPAEMLVAWNGLKSVHKIRAGQQLALYIVNDTTKPGNVATLSDTETRHDSTGNLIVLSDTKKQPALHKASTAKDTFSWYQIQKGDTLWKISQKFNISTSEIKRWNNLNSNLIHPGNRLKLRDV